jgi:CBASS immunity sensor of nucleotide second messenger signals
MANQVGARLAGDDYQHLIAWRELLGLMLPGGHIENVTVEDPEAGFVDDITFKREADALEPDLFLQVKYHVDHRSQYSTEVFLAKTGKGRSLLRKFYESWRALQDRGRPVELRLVTNWTWDSGDCVREVIRGKDNALDERFFTAPAESEIGKARERWRKHLELSGEEFRAFAATLRFWAGFDCFDELERRVAERMMYLGLRNDRAALLAGIGIVRDLVRARRVRLSRTDVEALIAEHGLQRPTSEEPAKTLYLSTVREQRFDLPPDFLLDWRELFEGDGEKRGHRVLDPGAWNTVMLPELLALERRLAEASPVRLVRARGLARLSAWFAFGYVFSDVARYTLEVDQQGKLWRTDAAPSGLGVVEEGRETIAEGDPTAVAVGISVTGPLVADVRRDLVATGAAGSVLFLRPDRPLGRDALTSAGDVVAFARGAKERMRAFAREQGARRLLLFYYGPLSGACFLGHQLNAVAREIQVMEDQQPGYAPSFLLT